METIMKTCKICTIEKEIKKFSGRSAVCSVCVYSTKKDKLKDYYINLYSTGVLVPRGTIK